MLSVLRIELCFQVCGSLQSGHLAVRGTRPRDQAPADQRRPQRDLCHSEGPSRLRPAAAHIQLAQTACCNLVGGEERARGALGGEGHVSSVDVFHLRSDSVPAVPGARWLFERHPVGLEAMNLSQSAC